MNRTMQVRSVIDIVGINSNQFHSSLDQKLRCIAGEKRMTFEISVSTPMPVPAGLHQHRLAFQWQALKQLARKRTAPLRRMHQDTFQTCQGSQRQLGKIFAICKSMEWTVEVRACVGHHLDAADVELCAWCVVRARSFAAEEIANQRRRQPFVSDHPMFNVVTEVDEHGGTLRLPRREDQCPEDQVNLMSLGQ